MDLMYVIDQQVFKQVILCFLYTYICRNREQERDGLWKETKEKSSETKTRYQKETMYKNS